MSLVLVVHVAATWFMVGLIWTIQLVHYPLFARVGAASLRGYEGEHTSRMGRLLVAPASLEVATAAALVWSRPDEVGLGLVLLAGAVLAGLWVTTAVVQVPMHRELSNEPDLGTVRRLVRSNWLRTAGWTVRGVLVAAMLLRVV